MSDITLHIVGMRCDDCARKVAEEILGVEGVADAEVDAAAGRADVDLVEGEPASIEALTRAVEKAGFAVDHVDKPVFGG